MEGPEEIKKFLSQNNEGKSLTREELLKQVEAARALFKATDEKREAGLPHEIPEVDQFNDLLYGLDPKYNLLDVYLPSERQAGSPIPVIINIHGGGWIYGTKETYQIYCLSLAKYGFAVVNASYRLAPSVQFPAELEDLNQVFQWICKPEHAERYQLDLKNIFVIGDSAGAQMAEQLLVAYTNSEYRKHFGYQVPKLNIKAAVLNCGAYLLAQTDYMAGPSEIYFTPEVRIKNHDQLNAEKYLTSKMPPLFLMTATEDFLRDSTFLLSGYLRAKGIYHELHSYGDSDAPRLHDFQLHLDDPIATKCTSEEIEFFRKYMSS
ncbi:alpha/beta hydrolase [Xylocopilactobacillus apicola]|uniref:Lipase n=1 Tax=Xylocopilactobacillus apicola TaxID=2932184 RepID=A0AAU9CUW4_9LACO|nr:alpha/beta hydrolase [Xylocopilactobacillus apicola]BDR57794.1 lipase [Xylocopilactobacillus apicola]